MQICSPRVVLPSLFSLFCSIGIASAQERLPQVIPANAARATVPHTVFARAKASTDLGLANGSEQLASMSLRFALTSAQTVALDQLLADQQNPSSPRYHQWLTPEQFAASFGLSQTDINSARTWLEAQGFTITAVARGRTFISFSGTVAQASQAFGVSLHKLSWRGEQHVSNLADPQLPASLANVVLSVTGLNDFKLKPQGKLRNMPAHPNYYGGATQGNFIAPADFNTIYDINPLLTNSINGTGITIAVAGQTDIPLAEVTSFRTAAALPANLPTVQLAGTDPGSSTDDVPEAMLDVEWAGAIAPNASIIYVNGKDVFLNSVIQAIDNNVAPIVTVSYGNCETGFGTANTASYNVLFKQANAQGQTMLGPSGDSGAADCDFDTTYATNGLAVDFPSSSPYVTAVGGTEFNEAAGAYWSTSNGTGGSTALSYIPEQPWNETYDSTATIPFFGLANGGSGGGGVSQLFTKPAWQTGTGVPNDFSRDVPDIAFSASAEHDGYLVCAPITANGVSTDSCASGFPSAITGGTIYGGTSVATPAFAGILALLEQKLGTRLGNVNPTLYGLANSTYYGTVFHDVTSGNNAVPCTAGSVGCASGDPAYNPPSTIVCPANSCSGDIAYSSIGYQAATGYDLASGWGSMDINNMVNDWLLVTPAGTTSTIGTTASTTTVATSTPNVTAGGTATLTATVAAGTGTSTTPPTGTVQLLVDNAAAGAAVALANGTATLTYVTTSLSSGSHVFSVAYSGDTTYAGSKGSVSIDITSNTTADFSITPATQTVTVAAGGTSSGITYTVAPLNGFTGNVSFTASTNATTLNATYAFVPTTIALTTTASGTTVLTLEAFTTPTTGARARGFRNKVAALAPGPVVPWELAGSGVMLSGLLLICLPRRRRNWSALAIALVSIGVISVSGCSGNNGTPTTTTSSNINTTPGTYNLTVTASGTNAAGATISHSVAVTFVVQ